MIVIIPNRMKDRTIYMQIEFGLYDQFQVVSNVVLCSLPVELVKAFPNGPTPADAESLATTAPTSSSYDDDRYVNDDAYTLSSCTNVSGRYHLLTNYTVPKVRDNNFHYTPDLRLTFTDARNRTVGCTVTGPYSIMLANDVRSEHGWIALGIACSVFVSIFATLLLFSYSRNEERLKQTMNKDRKQRAPCAQRRRNSMDDRYQYFQTLPDGQVVPLPGVHPISQPSQQHFYKIPRPVLTVTRRCSGGATQKQQEEKSQPQIPDYLQNIPNDTTDDDDDDDDESEDRSHQLAPGQIASDPKYNEPQLPTRPVI